MFGKAKNHYFKAAVERNEGDCSNIWKTVNSFMRKYRKGQADLKELDESGKPVAGRPTANLTNRHFATVGQKQSSKFKLQNRTPNGCPKVRSE